MDSDALKSLRNSFYLGFYDQVAKEAKSLENNSNKEVAQWAQIYSLRAMAQVNPQDVFKSIPQAAATGLQAVKQLATYRAADDDQKEMVLDTLREWLNDEEMKNDATLQLIAAQIYFEEKNYKEALKLVAGANNLEKLSLAVMVYLAIDRPDLAAKAVKSMQELDDDDSLSILASAWLNIAQGGEKSAEALFSLQELQEKFGASISVLNSIAVCEIQQKNYTNALSSLKQARDQASESKQKVSAETLILYITCLQHLNKQEIIVKVSDELKKNYPNHPYLLKQKEMETMFDKHAANYHAKK